MIKRTLPFLIIILFTGTQLSAKGYNLAVKNWVAFQNQFAGFYGKDHPEYNTRDNGGFDPRPVICINPSASFRFDDKSSLALNLIYGGYEQLAYEHTGPSMNAGAKYSSNDLFTLTDFNYVQHKVDGDILYNRRLNGTFTVFGGLKYVFMYASGRYNMGNFPKTDAELAALPTEDLQEIINLSITYNNTPRYTFIQNSAGPGLGFGFNHNIAGNWFLLGGFSQTLLFAMTSSEFESYTSSSDVKKRNENYLVPCSNLKLTAAYFQASTRVTYEGGLQGQFYYYMMGSDGATLDNEYYYMLGPVFNVIFSF